MSKPGNTKNTTDASRNPRSSATRDPAAGAPAHGSARRHRLRLAECLRLIAGLRAQIEELQTENAQLQDVVAAQAERIAALRQDAANGSQDRK